MTHAALASISTAAALLIAAAGLALGGLALATTRRLRPALGVLLDLLLAAGLLRLAFLDTWKAIASAAALVVVRKLVVLALTSGAPARPGRSAGSAATR